MLIRRNVRLWTTAAILGAVLAGCESAKPAAEAPTPPPVDSAPSHGQVSPPATQVVVPADLPANETPADAPTDAVPDTTTPPPKPQSEVPADKKVETSSDTKPPASDDNAELAKYDAKKPALMGIRLKDTKSSVRSRYGEPAEEFIMNDERDPITVMAYKGFSVGFNSNGLVEFIEITSRDVNPGLNGLRLGQKVKDAEAAIGKPDRNTTYALHYKASGAILKLDIDPKDGTIQSIKLFPERS
jgi:hypothetical protein